MCYNENVGGNRPVQKVNDKKVVPVLEQVLCLLKSENQMSQKLLPSCAHECTCEHICLYVCVCVRLILAEPEGGGAPALCHSVASAASFRT